MGKSHVLNKRFHNIFNTRVQSILCILLLLSIFSCKDDNAGVVPEEDFMSDLYANASSLTIQVAYEEGASPFIKYNRSNAWEVCNQNITNLLSPRGISVNAPLALREMTNLGVLEQNNYTRENLEKLAGEVQQYTNKTADKGIVIIFLNGYYIKDSKPENRILGINLDGTPILAVFKPVVKSASNNAAEQALIEQSTIVHEIGHALGLVNNGVRATSAHDDAEHGAHCTNTKCVMYWQHGGTEVQQFIQPFLLNCSVDLFGNKCKADIKAK
ncbi:MAG: putative Zn-dependent protease [Bacteroidia bacterium]|jgi:predicted Zn-dependent protease